MKGVIADVNKNKAVMLSENGEFITVPNNNYVIGQQITYVNASYKKYVAIAACFIFTLLLGAGGYKAYYTPVSYVDIDINPSIRLEINIFDKVIRAIPLNEDATVLLNNSGKLSWNLQECITELIDNSEKNGFINETNKDVELHVISDKQEVFEETATCLETVEKSKDIQVSVQQDDKEVFEKAKELNVSVGHLKKIQERGEISDEAKSDAVTNVSNENKSDTSNSSQSLPSNDLATKQEDVISNKENTTSGKNDIALEGTDESTDESATESIGNEQEESEKVDKNNSQNRGEKKPQKPAEKTEEPVNQGGVLVKPTSIPKEGTMGNKSDRNNVTDKTQVDNTKDNIFQPSDNVPEVQTTPKPQQPQKAPMVPNVKQPSKEEMIDSLNRLDPYGKNNRFEQSDRKTDTDVGTDRK